MNKVSNERLLVWGWGSCIVGTNKAVCRVSSHVVMEIELIVVCIKKDYLNISFEIIREKNCFAFLYVS